MGNTRKGNYAAKSSEEVHEAPVSKSAMHGVRMRRFQCMSPKAHLSEQEDIYIGRVVTNAENAPGASKAHISDMDSNDLDYVPLARLMKKNSVPNVAFENSTDPILSIHSLESSSSEDDVTISNSNVDPANAPTDEPIATGGRSDVHAVDTPANYEDNGEHVNTGVNDGEIPANESVEANVNNDPQPENHPILEPINGIPAVTLSAKYAILHKIGIANLFSSSHTSKPEAPEPDHMTLSLSYRLFQGSHVPDIDHDVRPSRGPHMFDTNDWDENAGGFFVN
ncbi:uncharacterized protein E5676_scaffold68G00060 [Cucumis melo var. makuwa]|uniref:Envelope-like protein n=1 Tax=Cucumis melo var. makuwa TaxID=1194695 RepID=A0A5A7SLX7_CUCMM|nr:uncharacterized protein E6C27_scaffold417G00640 [Cucumis melo var. makuwa]TYK04716.1 uncharacterized protein E5676_scaffold68G00060 [Cucumis melo var. makuwa]